MVSIVFETFEAAVAYAKGGAGGWLCRSECGKFHAWFAPSVTQSRIIDVTGHFGTRTIGTWPMFAEGGAA
jgi:hypothetical protein